MTTALSARGREERATREVARGGEGAFAPPPARGEAWPGLVGASMGYIEVPFSRDDCAKVLWPVLTWNAPMKEGESISWASVKRSPGRSGGVSQDQGATGKV